MLHCFGNPTINQVRASPLHSTVNICCLPFCTAQEALLGTALTDTQAALNVALNAMSLATTMCSNGSPEAADKALEFAEKALTMTVQRLATAQTLVLETVEQQQDQGVQLPEHAAEIAHHLAAAVGSSDDSRPARDSAAAVRGTARDTKNNKLDTCSSTGS